MSPSRTILVTGASRGIGRGLAEHLAEKGHDVIGCSRGDCAFEHSRYRHVTADITVDQDVRELFSILTSAHHGLDVLINNAGQSIDGLALLATRAQANSMVETNLVSAMVVTREALKLMKRGKFGRIVNISSISVPLGSVGTAIYGATKAAIAQFSHTLAREIAQDDITVNTIGVSLVEDSTMVKNMDSKALDRMRASLLKPHFLEIAEIAHAVEFYVSDHASNITDQTIYFGGVR